MSIWVSVYCRKRTGTIKPASLVAAIKDRVGRFSYLYAREDPEETLARLRVESFKQPTGPALLHLHYLEEGPPIVIDRITRPQEVAGDVREYLEEEFHGRTGKEVDLVRAHLSTVVEIASFCLKQMHADGMGTPLTYAAAAWLAELGDGLVRVDEQGWLRLTRGGRFLILVPG